MLKIKEIFTNNLFYNGELKLKMVLVVSNESSKSTTSMLFRNMNKQFFLEKFRKSRLFYLISLFCTEFKVRWSF